MVVSVGHRRLAVGFQSAIIKIVSIPIAIYPRKLERRSYSNNDVDEDEKYKNTHDKKQPDKRSNFSKALEEQQPKENQAVREHNTRKGRNGGIDPRDVGESNPKKGG